MKTKMTETEKMRRGLIYDPADKDILSEQASYLDNLYEYNNTRPSEQRKREKLLKKLFAEVGSHCYIQPPFHANWGGRNVFLGDSVYANSNFTLVDDGEIYIGNYVMFGPNVVVATASHPIEPELRRKAFQFNIPVRINDNVWIGAGAILLPGITIGENSVIGAGSVVTKDIPKNVIAVGNPCKVVREIGERDRIYYYKNKKIDQC